MYMRNFLLAVFYTATLSACSSSYIAKLKYQENYLDFSLIENEFAKICSEVKPNGKLRVVDPEQRKPDYEKMLSCDLESQGYLQTYFFLAKPKQGFGTKAKILWGKPSGHLGTSIGNSVFPKWYCKEYLEMYKRLNKNYPVIHDEKLKKKCHIE